MTVRGTVYLVDDDPSVLRMLSRLMDTMGVEVRAYASADEFLAAYLPGPCQCLVSDLRMPGMGGLELQKRLRTIARSLPIIFISGYAEVDAAVEAMKSGAFDFVQKPFGAQALLDRVQQALTHSRERHAEEQARVSREARLALLTPKERVVAELVVEGHSSREIADRLGLSLRTVENHRARILDKLHAKSVVELVRLLK